MISILAVIAALVALLTGFAMLKDTHITREDRAAVLAMLRRAAIAARWHGLGAVNYAELQQPAREVLRILVLLIIVPSSGVAAFESLIAPPPDPYELLLRCSLAAYLAMQAPCPWIHWIARGDRRQAQRPLPAGERRGAH